MMHKALLPTLLLMSLATVVVGADAKGVEYIRPFPIVMYHDSAAKELKPFAEQIAQLVAGKSLTQSMPRNLVCCVWFEITQWTPNPGKPGYIIVNQRGGSIIQASNVEQMKVAVARFKSTAKRTGNGIEVPKGLLTNFKIID